MKNILLFAVITLFYACKTKEVVTPNRPPSAFTVTPTLKGDGKTITLNWTKAKDPDGDVITYTVVLKDTLAKNISDTTYTIANLDFNYSQTGKVIAKDAKGLKTETSFTATTKVQVFVNIPDPIFEKYLIDNKIDKDGVVNGKMNVDDAKGVTEISVNSKSIKSLAGIEVFTDLQALRCSNNQLTTLDVSKNVNLYRLFCPNNQLTTLDVNKNLQALECSSNQLTVLDVTKNIDLVTFDCSYNQLTTLDISKNAVLQNFSCSSNLIKTICVADKVKADANKNWYKDKAATYEVCK